MGVHEDSRAGKDTLDQMRQAVRRGPEARNPAKCSDMGQKEAVINRKGICDYPSIPVQEILLLTFRTPRLPLGPTRGCNRPRNAPPEKGQYDALRV